MIVYRRVANTITAFDAIQFRRGAEPWSETPEWLLQMIRDRRIFSPDCGMSWTIASTKGDQTVSRGDWLLLDTEAGTLEAIPGDEFRQTRSAASTPDGRPARTGLRLPA